MRLTDISIRALPVPEKGQKTYADNTLVGFGVRVSPGGSKTFVVVCGPTRERITIGRFPILGLSEARTEAKRILAEKTIGKHRPKTITFADAKDKFLAFSALKNRPRTVSDYTRLFKHFAFGKTHLGDITRHDVSRRLERIAHTPAEHGYALVVIKMFFRWAVRDGYLDNSPCEGLRRVRGTVARERALGVEELSNVLTASLMEPYPYGPIVRLILLTGQRRGEIARLEWEWIDRANRTITLPSSLTKNKREHTLPYGDMTAAVLDRLPVIDNAQYLFPAQKSHIRNKPTTVFNSWSKAKKLFDKNLTGVKPWTLHDLRRTFSTNMAALGIEQIVVEKLLNHVSGGTQSPIARVYNRHSYMAEMREAIQTYEGYLAKLLKN